MEKRMRNNNSSATIEAALHAVLATLVTDNELDQFDQGPMVPTPVRLGAARQLAHRTSEFDAVAAVVQMKDRRRPFVEDCDDELVSYLQTLPLEIINAAVAEHLAAHGRINVRPTIETVSPIVSKLQNWPTTNAARYSYV
jgi:hypothetical protein